MTTQTGVQVTGAQPITLTNETIIATLVVPPENQPGGQGLYLDGMINITTGATGTTGIVTRVRQTNLAGALIGNALTHNQLTAGNTISVVHHAIDPVTTYLAGQTYVLTVQQNAATANGNVNFASLRSDPVTPVAG